MRPGIDFAGVADEAANRGSPLFVCVCPDGAAAEFGVRSVALQWSTRVGTEAELIPLFELLCRVQEHQPAATTQARRSLMLVADAWRGDSDTAVVEGWRRLNAVREAIRAYLAARDAALILFVTEEMFRVIARSDAAIDFLGLAQVEQADDESPAAEFGESDLIREQGAVLSTMEARYGLDTAEFVRRLLVRDLDAFNAVDVARWSAAVSMLRKVAG